MCYSARIKAEWKAYMRTYGVRLDLERFHDLFWRRARVDSRLRVPKAMEALFDEPANDDERAIRALIDEHRAAQALRLQEELFAQRKRLADAERSLAARPTKAAAESRRIAAARIEAARGRLAALQRREPIDEDARIFPQYHAPVMVLEGGQRVLRPMRYQCRPPGRPALFDRKYPGTYNARRDSLGGFWKDMFGFSHGLLLVDAFFENVARHRAERRELQPGEAPANLVLEFRPRPSHDMLVACLWSRCTEDDGHELLSFAAITDEPPPEVLAAGHDRCIVPIRPENIDAWLAPDPRDLARQQRLLDERDRPYYEHRIAA